MIKRIDHIAIVVDDIDQALGFYAGTLGLQPSAVLAVPQERVKIAFLPTGESEIELLEPTDTESGVARYLAKHGPGMHHICLEVDDIRHSLQELADHGAQVLNQEPQVNSEGKLYAFVHPKSTHGVLLELYQSPK
jgi:methylmalonyl-CoA epimerase